MAEWLCSMFARRYCRHDYKQSHWCTIRRRGEGTLQFQKPSVIVFFLLKFSPVSVLAIIGIFSTLAAMWALNIYANIVTVSDVWLACFVDWNLTYIAATTGRLSPQLPIPNCASAGRVVQLSSECACSVWRTPATCRLRHQSQRRAYGEKCACV